MKGVRTIRKKILFGITSLEFGGAERVLVDIANRLSDKYEITIFSIYDDGALKKELNSNIHFKALYNCKYEKLSKLGKIWSPIRILFFSKLLYSKYVKSDYDVEISFLEGPITRLFSNKNRATKKIAWIHNDISRVFGKGAKSKMKKLIDRCIYKKYESLVFVSNDNMETFKKIYTDIDSDKMLVIYNYIDSELIKKKAKICENTKELAQSEHPIFVSVCRLVQQKAIDRFIRVHAKLVKDGYRHTVCVIGDGSERDNLIRLAEELKVTDSFKIIGKRENPYPYIKSADYFCLLSYYEGYGMVIEEAKILNKKIIITDTAAREAIDGYNNALVIKNDEQMIYEGLKNIIMNKGNFEDVNDSSYDNSEYLNKIVDLIEK